MINSASASSFASLEERLAHLAWRKSCNERHIQSSLQLTRQLQERDEFLRISKQYDVREKREWMQHVISDELHRPLPVTKSFYDELLASQKQDEKDRKKASLRHMANLKQIQTKLAERENQLIRKREYKRKKEAFLHALYEADPSRAELEHAKPAPSSLS